VINYSFRKILEGRDKVAYEKKRLVRETLAGGKRLSTELRASYDTLKESVDAEDTRTSEVITYMDDEYGDAGLIEPRVCVTTSRDPSCQLKQFAKEMKLLVPNSTRINRVIIIALMNSWIHVAILNTVMP
jgi:U3 small nucleolar ribonucleoprotein protein IMP4